MPLGSAFALCFAIPATAAELRWKAAAPHIAIEAPDIYERNPEPQKLAELQAAYHQAALQNQVIEPEGTQKQAPRPL